MWYNYVKSSQQKHLVIIVSSFEIKAKFKTYLKNSLNFSPKQHQYQFTTIIRTHKHYQRNILHQRQKAMAIMIHSRARHAPSGKLTFNMKISKRKHTMLLHLKFHYIFSHKSNLQRSSNGPLLPEATIWSIIMQLTAGLRAIHQAGLACK